ncbi:Uncharacterised protein [Mycobacterium tuberculosis]|nr:Uncharacterised protein [Mycobacterium tuberculosis]
MPGPRGRRFVRRFFFSACVALLALPLLTVYTHLFGREVSLRVDRCERQVRYGYECHGSWTDADGHRHSTKVAHVGPKDVGRTVEARLGPWPMSAHAGRLGSEAIMLVPGALLLLCVPGYLVLRRRLNREVGATAQHLLDAPEDFLVLEVDRDGAVRPGGEPHLRVQFGDPDVPVPVGADRRRFASARRPDGEVAFLIERRTDEVLMLSADGRPEALIPHLALQSGRPRIERPDGALLGEIALTRGHTSDVHSVVRPDGREVGRFARLRRRTWALCLSPECSPVLAYTVLAYLFTEGRAD